MSGTKNSPEIKHRFNSSHAGTACGQLEARYVVGDLILLVIGKPLLNVGAQLRGSISTISAFSEIEAAMIALLFVVSIAAAILGFE